jgi:hypothetical protein
MTHLADPGHCYRLSARGMPRLRDGWGAGKIGRLPASSGLIGGGASAAHAAELRWCCAGVAMARCRGLKGSGRAYVRSRATTARVWRPQ